MSRTSSTDHLDLRSDVRSDVPGTILVALDGSAFAESALAHARPLARALGRSLHLVTVLDTARTGVTSGTSAEGRLQRLEAVSGLERIADTLRADGHDCTYEVREGQPSAEVLSCVAEREIGAVALAAHPWGPEERSRPGSVTHGVLTTSMASLLVARGKGGRAGRAGRSAEVRYRRIGVPMDGSPASHRALRLASFLAGRDGAEVVLAHVLTSARADAHSTEVAASPGPAGGTRVRETADALRYLEVAERQVGLLGVGVRCRLFYSWPEADALQSDVDLVVIAVGGEDGEARRYGAGTRRLLLRGRIPALMLRCGAPMPAEPWTPRRSVRATRRAEARRPF